MVGTGGRVQGVTGWSRDTIPKSSTKGTVSFYLIYYYPSLIPPSIASIYYAILITFILFISKVMPSYSYCIKKGLIYITIIVLFSY